MISIIIPLYNKEKSIEQTIKSVLSQSNKEIELIVVDDGSKDKSFEIVQNLFQTENLFEKHRLIHQENGGPSKARNTGMENSSGDWILFLDADDELQPDALQTYADLANTHGDADIIDCGQSVKDPNTGEIRFMKHDLEGYSKNPMRDWYFRRIGPGSNHSIFKASFICNYPYDTRIRRFEDAELLSRILQKAKVFSSTIVTSLVHTEFSAASGARKDIKEDFMGYLDMIKGGFWYKMCVFRTFIEEREHYPIECHQLYPCWYMRYDLMFLHILLLKTNSFV